MKNSVKKETKELIKEENLNCSVEEFKDKISWNYRYLFQTVSEDKANWWNISKYQYLSEDFIKEFQDKINWYWISKKQILSEDFIREFKDKVDWIVISECQKLSEKFAKEFKDKISEYSLTVLNKYYIKK